MTSKVVMNTRRSFGGIRIAGGHVSVDLWSDGVVIGAAWSDSQPGIEGAIFSFRGTLLRNTWTTRRHQWVLRSDDGTFVGDFANRDNALSAVDGRVVMDAFRELNRVQAEDEPVWTLNDSRQDDEPEHVCGPWPYLFEGDCPGCQWRMDRA